MATILAGSIGVAARVDAAPCGCPGLPDLDVVAPLLDTPLPTNGKLLVRTDLADPKVFVNAPNGAEVATHLEPAGGDYAWLVLDQEIEPASQYKVTAAGEDLSRFNAWSGVDTTAPVVGGVTSSVTDLAGSCFHVQAVVLALSGASDDSQLPLTVRLELDVPESESVLYFPDKDPTFIAADRPSDCFVEAPGTLAGGHFDGKVTVFDRAGNAAEPISVEIAFPVPQEDDAGCAIRPGARPARWPTLLALAALALGRRRRRSRDVTEARRSRSAAGRTRR